jgi:hypothetical protein
VLQDMSIDVYGRKEEDAPEQETPSSSNGVCHLTTCYPERRIAAHLSHAVGQ